MTKKSLILGILATLFLTGCATRRSAPDAVPGRRLSRFSLTPPVLKVVIKNNTTSPLLVEENGQPLTVKDAAGQWQEVFILPGRNASFDYYAFLGSSEVILSANGYCPSPTITPSPNIQVVTGQTAGVMAPAIVREASPQRRTTGCTPGEFLGTDSRRFAVHSGQGYYRTEFWEVNYLRAPVQGAR